MGEYSPLSHEFLPVFDERSNVLILGRFPSVKSREQTGMEITVLPSTSPANAAFSLERLVEVWREEIRER